MKLGTDIVQIERIKKAIDKQGLRFKERYLSQSEIEMAKKTDSLAGLWAAKEAVAKALGCGIGKELSFHDIVVAKDEKGSPYFTLSKKAKSLHKIKESSLSISHDGGFAIAIVAIEFIN